MEILQLAADVLRHRIILRRANFTTSAEKAGSRGGSVRVPCGLGGSLLYGVYVSGLVAL